MSDDNNTMLYEWRKVRYKGDAAKNTLGLANQGIGYIVLESGKDKGETYCIVAYKQPLDRQIPDHVEELTTYEMKKVEWRIKNGDKPKSK